MTFKLQNPPEKIKSLKNRYIFLDANYLSFISTDEQAMKDCLNFLTGYRTVDQFIRIEFLRNASDPLLNKKREELLKIEGLFAIMDSSNENFKNLIQDKIIWLSRLYDNNKRGGLSASLIDLILGAHLITYSGSLVVTENLKDFPSELFNIEGILTYVNEKREFKNFSILELNKANLEASIERYETRIKSQFSKGK